jgi:hypothetical protein
MEEHLVDWSRAQFALTAIFVPLTLETVKELALYK